LVHWCIGDVGFTAQVLQFLMYGAITSSRLKSTADIKALVQERMMEIDELEDRGNKFTCRLALLLLKDLGTFKVRNTLSFPNVG
jgi:hypothetical protein